MCQEPAVLGAKNAVLSKLTNFKPDLQDGVWLLGWGLVGQTLRLNNLPMSSPYIFLQPFLEHVWNSLCVPLFVPLLFWMEKKKKPQGTASVFTENARCLPRPLSACCCLFSSYGVDSVIFFELQRRKLTPREVRQVAQDCRACGNFWMKHLCINCHMLAIPVSSK